MLDPRILEIETCALNAWPAQETIPLDGWLLRAHTAPLRRVNSVWPNALQGRVPLEQKLEQVEVFYWGKGRPARYQVCDAARPAGLDDVLAARGYTIEAPTNVQVSSVDAILQRGKPTAHIPVEAAAVLTDSWTAAYCRVQGAPESDLPLRRTALESITRPVCYVQAKLGGQAAAVGRAVFENSWMGIFGMATHPAYRRRGAGTAVLRALAACARERGTVNLYLQVMQNNGPALEMYAGLGFETLYTYHYRSCAIPPDYR